MPIGKEDQFVELNRRFRKLEQNVRAEDVAVDSYTSGFSWQMGSVNWDDLLKENRVVVLGEPGSGKSWEMKERARLLNSQGASAFYVRLDQLLERELSDVLDPNEQASLIRWKNGRDIAWFYLDSVDEAKFRRVSDFHSTLARFSKEFDSYQLLRTKVFLSSRISEWKPSTDRHEFQRLFPLPPFEKRTSEGQSTESQNLNPELLVVQMEPLDRNQVERFAAAKGVSDVTAFTEALDRAFAWEFARRPLDVVGLIEFWGANGTIGSLTQLIEFDVSSKLRPREGRDEFPLSEAEAREGAEWLAAASVFSRRFSFRVPDDGLPIAASLDPRACLPSHWRDEQIRALLNRAIFDSASYGNFRFHHRRVGEYLAARWITARMERGCPQFVLESILAEVVRGRKVLRPSMRSIAAWLCGGSERWNEMVRSIVIETDTGIHLRYGDPARLSLEYRRQILFSLSGLSKIRNRMWIESTPDCLARVADSGLSTDIKKMILDRGLAVDFRMELLEIVRHGRLKACADSALQVVASSDEPTDLKCYAVSAIGAIDNPELHEQLFHSVCQMPCIPRQLCSSLLQALYPRAISSEQLVQALAKTESIQEFTVNLPFYLKSHFETVVTPTGAGDLLKGLTSLAQSPPHVLRGQITLPVSSRFCWIAELIPTLLEILFRESTLSAEETATAAQSVRLLCHVHDFRHFVREDFDRLNRSILCHPEIRRSYLWHMAADFRMEHGKEPTTLMHLFDYWEVLRLSQDDFSWLLEDISGRTEFNDRLLALQLAIELWDASGRTLRNRWRLRRAVANDASLRAAFRQSIVASPLLPLKRFWWRNVRQKYLERWCWRRRFDAMLRRWYWLRAQTWLLCHLRFLGSGVELRWLSALAHEADEKNNSRWTRSTWSGLEKKRGKLITRATKRGCMAAWRGFRPELPHEKPNPSQTSIGVLVGLTGLQVEFENSSGAIRNLKEDEARLAARYAMDELNGFPEWFDQLAELHPTAVADVLRECVGAEWQVPAERQERCRVLDKLAWSNEGLGFLVHEKLLSLLSTGDPPSRAVLMSAISILMRQANPPLGQLAQVAAQRLSSTCDPGNRDLWLTIWMQIDGDAAVAYLADTLKSLSNPEDLIVRLCSNLSGEEMRCRLSVENPNYLRPSCLRRLIPIVYQYVRISDDIDRSSGAYSPTERDHAQRFRSMILNRLENDEDSATPEVLRELADDPAMQRVRDWILNMLDKRLVNEADSDPWTAADIREFAEHYEVDPKSDRELFAIACNRLQVLKWDVEKSDNSARTELRKDDREIELRRWLQRRLIERSQNRYTIPQEAEIDQQERPDLRLENPKTNPVSIEVKWAENLTLAQLLERLENQLVGQYLRAHNSRYGIYLLGFIGKKQNWMDPTTGKKLSSNDIVDIIRDSAISLMKTNSNIAGLEVVSIDFR